MTLKVGVGGAWKDVANLRVGVGGAWKQVQTAWVGVGGTWKVAYSALSVSASNVLGTNSGYSSSGVVNGTGANATPSGGSGSYSYLWEHVSTTSGNTPGISSSAVANPTWSATVTDLDSSISTWKVTVTDTSYGVTAEDTISVTLVWTNLS